MPRSINKIKKARINFGNMLKIAKNLSGNFIESYFLNDLIDDRMHNDLGASFTYFKRNGKYIKKIARKEGESKLIDEINWYLRFKDTALKKNLPIINSYSRKRNNVYLEMKYYTYPNLRKIIIDDMNLPFVLRKRWKAIFDIFEGTFFTPENSKEAPEDYVLKSHFRKLDSRLSQAKAKHPLIRQLLRTKRISINGKHYVNALPLALAIMKDGQAMKRLRPQRVYISHGDVHCNNILCGVLPENVILIDCRGRSPYGDEYFDPAYDIAKIYHDVRSMYSLMERQNYTLFLSSQGGSPSVTYTFNRPDLVVKFLWNKKVVDKHVARLEKRHKDLSYRAEFTEAMLYLTMIPFHMRNPADGVLCYSIGTQRLNEWAAKHHPEILKRVRGSIQ